MFCLRVKIYCFNDISRYIFNLKFFAMPRKSELFKWFKNLMNTKDLAYAFNADEKTIKRWRKKGLPFLMTGGGYLYDPVKVKEWLERNSKKTDDSEEE